MALSRSLRGGQFAKCCELCENEIEINWKCINCNLLMCTKCKEKVHSKIKSADKHKIIDIKEVGQHSEDLDFSHINCDDHERQTCVLFCKSCDRLVCPRCIAEIHNGHELVQINKVLEIKIENVKEIHTQIKRNLQELTNVESQIKLLRNYEHSKYTETKNQIQAQNAALKRDVDTYTEKLHKEFDQKWKAIQNHIDEEERKVTALKIKQEDQNTKAKDIINCNDAEQIFKESKLMEKLKNDTMEPVKLDFNTIPKFLPGEITEYNFGSLQDVAKDLIMNIHQQLRTDINNVIFLSTCPDNSLWIGDGNLLQRVKPEGSKLKVMSNFNINIFRIALTPSNELLLLTEEQSRLKQISDSSPHVTESVYSVDSLFITAVHVTKDYNLLVGARSPGPLWPATNKRVVIRMNKEGKHEETYEHDRNKQTIFSYVNDIITTSNGTIFVVDKLSKDWIGRVVVLGQDGDVINTYNGHPRINNDDKQFRPMRVVKTPLDNIIVIELNMPNLHILNSIGHPITYFNTKIVGILCPFSLSFTSSGHLYIGCKSVAGKTDKGKLHEVEISRI